MSTKNILLVAPNFSTPNTRRLVLEHAGYTVAVAKSPAEAMDLLNRERFALVMLEREVAAGERQAVAGQAKALEPAVSVLAFHGGIRGQHEDAQISSLESPSTVLRTVGKLVMQNHGHPEISAKYVAYVDRFRHYVYASEAFCELVGYGFEELAGLTIDEVTYPETAQVGRLFQQYLEAGKQAGIYVLKHRSGRPVPVTYHARVMEDGCLISELEPLPAQAAG